MGVFGKFTTKRKSVKDVNSYAQLEEGAPMKQAYAPTKPVVPIAKELADDDEPTIFTTFMVLYLGFFGLTLLFYPYIHAADASPWNPAAYWTTISPSTAFAFRIAGGAFLTLILGPFLDEIFGGVGVLMKAFTRQCLIVNFIAFFLFLYFSFYAPLDDAIPFIWKGQTIFAGFVLAWSIIEAIPLQYLPGSYVLFNVLMYSGFGVGLTAIPDLAFGPPSPVAYWNEWGPLDLLTGRSLGLSLLILVTLGAVYASGPGFCKQVTAFNLINLGLFVIPAFYGGASAVTSMWLIQFVFTVPIVLVGIYLELVGATGTWAPAFSCPACGLNVESFNMFNLFFYLPFAAGFLSPYANLMFGPNTPTGFPMFNQEFGETALWFTKAWATCVLLLTLGPYLFSLSPVKTAKQMALAYIVFTGLFIYTLVTTDLFNMVMMGPLTGLNVVLAIVGVYVSATSSEGLLSA